MPYKKKIIPYLDELSEEAKKTESVNTVFMKDDKLIGHNTDIEGFELSIRDTNFDVKKKNNFYTRCRRRSTLNNLCS